MIKLLIPIMLLLVGCHNQPVYTPSQCPTFNAKLSIVVYEHNTTHSAVTWGDVSDIETFLEQKRVFNEGVKEINNGLAK